jgi:hypothetical protein
VARVHYFREWMASALPDGPLKDEVARLPGTRALLVAGKCPRLVHPIDLRNTDRKIVVRIGVDRPADGGAPPPYERHPEPRHEIAPLSRAGGVLATDPGLLVASRLVADGARCRRRALVLVLVGCRSRPIRPSRGPGSRSSGMSGLAGAAAVAGFVVAPSRIPGCADVGGHDGPVIGESGLLRQLRDRVSPSRISRTCARPGSAGSSVISQPRARD